MGFTAYTLEQYNTAMKLKANGLGSLRISKILGFNDRNVIEGWINQGRKPYYFSEARINACNSKENVERMRKMNKLTQPRAVEISAILRTKKLPESAKILSKNLAYILGVVYGDGHVSVKQRKIILSATDYEFVDTFKKALEEWSEFKVRFYSRMIKKPYYIKTRKLQWVAYIDSIEAAKFLSGFNLPDIYSADPKVISYFLKGFFDSEGCIDNKGSIYAYNTDYKLIQFVRSLLDLLDITNTCRSYYGFTPDKSKKVLQYSIRISSKSKKTFKSLIGFSIYRKQIRLDLTFIEKRRRRIKMDQEDYGVQEGTRKSADDYTVFVGAKPFMKLS